MDDHCQPESEFTHSTTCKPESAPPASGIFSYSRKFTVTAETLTNITNHYAAPSLPSDFRMIPMGDIDLRHEIRMDKYTGVSYFQRQRACVRRMHSAKAIIASQKSRVTVVIYQGNDAELEWRRKIAKYMALRHPNIVQICGAASTGGIHAMLFNDDLIPVQEILDRHRDSHFSTVYIHACYNQDFTEAFKYIHSEFQQGLGLWGYTLWIRHSTGRLCTELTPTDDTSPISVNPSKFPNLSRIYPFGAEAVTAFINSLTLAEYHRICSVNLRQYRCFDISASTIMSLGAVFRCSSDLFEDSTEIAFLPSVQLHCLYHWTISGEGTRDVMPEGWTRYFYIGRWASS
ncbi:hypothetical protein MSAN_00121300 [Mycena sanguinolenta]|uniref:Protein kinase domain-containing protein n=1 Tax=Mycena sanguinolenta TaxID=230812 RepID=A0A8H6ZGL6_9AGAR|nr:hypothetical protein MSAN_00121300 [Mycena sanguinolenta]